MNEIITCNMKDVAHSDEPTEDYVLSVRSVLEHRYTITTWGFSVPNWQEKSMNAAHGVLNLLI